MRLEDIKIGDAVVFISSTTIPPIIKEENLGIVKCKGVPLCCVQLDKGGLRNRLCRAKDLYPLRNRADLVAKVAEKHGLDKLTFIKEQCTTEAAEIYIKGGYSSGQRGQTVNPVA